MRGALLGGALGSLLLLGVAGSSVGDPHTPPGEVVVRRGAVSRIPVGVDAPGPGSEFGLLNEIAPGRRGYDNLNEAATQYYSGQAGEEAIDDLHGTLSDLVLGVTFEYYEPDTTVSNLTATVRIFDNPGGLDLGISQIGSPLVATGLTPGRHRVYLPTEVGVAGQDLWVGIRFNSVSAGVVLNAQESVGYSHDYYLENGQFFIFQDGRPAKFAVRVYGQSVTGVPDGPVTPGPVLRTAVPNPFRSRTSLSYSLADEGPVTLDVLDVQGRRVRSLVSGTSTAGEHTAIWDGLDDEASPVSAGLYFVQLATSAGVRLTKILLTP